VLARAREIAARTGDGNRMGTAFGHVNVAMHAISASLQLGDAKTAIETGTSTAPAAVRTPALIICSAAYGLALAWAGVQIAARQAQERLPELCQIAVHGTI
jgi:hypothetical protein